MSAGKFECLKYSFRQSKDGVVIAILIHPSDVSPELMALPIGARVEIEWTECTDEEPASNREMPPDVSGGAREAVPVLPRAAEDSGRLPKERKRFLELPLSAQAGMRCAEPSFRAFLRSFLCTDCKTEHQAAVDLRGLCHVGSRREFDADGEPAARWRRVEASYQAWLTEQSHGALAR